LVDGSYVAAEGVDEFAVPAIFSISNVNQAWVAYLALQILVWLSQPALAMRDPSGEKVT